MVNEIWVNEAVCCPAVKSRDARALALLLALQVITQLINRPVEQGSLLHSSARWPRHHVCKSTDDLAEQ